MKQLILYICLPLSCLCQNTIGIPDVINYSKEAYNAGLQNWDIKQDKNGIIYIANNEGLLSFDGKYWNLYKLPNKTIVRSVEIANDNRIYVGGQDEMGYFSPTVNGNLGYHSLTELLSSKNKSFGDVWDIVSFNKSIFFRSTNKIFKFTNGQVAEFNAPSEWSYLGLCNGKLFAHDYVTGIMEFENDAWKALPEKNPLAINDPVTALLPISKDSVLVSTLKNGLYVLAAKGLYKLSSPNNKLFEHERIYAATMINANLMAVATNNNGIYITDLKGNIVQSFSRTEGLQNNNVLSIFLDDQSNLWLGLDNGIDLIAYNSAIKHISPSIENGSGYSAIIHGDRLYAGTTNGVYSLSLQPIEDLSFSKGIFEPVGNTMGQTWGLAAINNQLLLGRHEGAFLIKDNVAQPISANTGFWNFVPLTNSFPTQQMIAGNYKGLVLFDYINGQFKQAGFVQGFNESSRFVTIDNEENIWVSHPYHGIYKIKKDVNGNYKWKIYSDKNGLPSVLNNHIFKIKNEILAGTENGIYKFNSEKDIFEPFEFYKKLLGRQSIRYLKEDISGNTWFFHEKTLGVIDISGKEASVTYFPELKNKLLSGFEFIYPVDEQNIFLGGETGFYHINYEKYKKTIPDLHVQIRVVQITGKTDSVLFGGYFKEINAKQIQEATNIPAVIDGWKTIRFEFASSLFGYQANLEYSYRLKGYDDSWSSWTKQTEKEYTNLSTGNYQFETKVRNNLGVESDISAYSFNILPPWYLSIWAKTLALLLVLSGIYLLYNRQQKKFKRQQEIYEEEQKRIQYIHELELNKTESELVALRNEKLEVEINYNNSEMASTAMHLVKKGELSSKIKAELSQLIKSIDNPQAIAEIKRIIKTLSEDDNLDKEWEHFAINFDKVHSDFLAVIKEKHPGISPNELKLCAYLRLNLSTKEIAQMMNISVRGVEISRYRLRKKLGISTETSLFDYLISH